MRSLSFLAFALLLAVSIMLSPSCRRNPLCPVGIEPYITIVSPPAGDGVATYPPNVLFELEKPAEFRLLHMRRLLSENINPQGEYDPAFDMLAELNVHPESYEDLWSRWRRFPGSEPTVIGDDEVIADLTLEDGKKYLFAVQAKDPCGRTTTVFSTSMNARVFVVSSSIAPVLEVREPLLGYDAFSGTEGGCGKHEIPPAVPLNFSWLAEGDLYGGCVFSYRYGWDIQDPNNPSEWATASSPFVTSAPERRFYSGVHTLHIEAVDEYGNVTLGCIQLEVLPITMGRNLLIVDDYMSPPETPFDYSTPGEADHDAFWNGICALAVGFDPSQDQYDCVEENMIPPTLVELGRYKNVIWCYSHMGNCWNQVVDFVPEDKVIVGAENDNPLPLFLAAGGHVWTLGRGDGNAGLAAVFGAPSPPMPASFAPVSDPPVPGEDYTGGMGYRDYCVSVVDKVIGVFREDLNVLRHVSRDALTYAYLENADVSMPGYTLLPPQLDLWEEITKPDRFCYPPVRSFPYVEAYDPEYYMLMIGAASRSRFHPIYRMRTRNSLSPLNDAAVALWVTTYAHVVPNSETGVDVAAPSMHLGFPLWFFDHEQAAQLAFALFTEWGIEGSAP